MNHITKQLFDAREHIIFKQSEWTVENLMIYCVSSGIVHTAGIAFWVLIQYKDDILPVRKSHCGDKTVVRSSYLQNEISYTGKMSSLY